MKKSKRLFLIGFVIFIIAMIIIGIDISRKTTFPGSKKLLKESIMPSDTTELDSLNQNNKH